MSRTATITRTTNETEITITVTLDGAAEAQVSTGLPFLDHMLTALAFHGEIGLVVLASGDVTVDPHHLVEDTGIVLGSCLDQIFRDGGPVKRFGHAVIPMDEALSEATIDICGRPTLHYHGDFPQDYSGEFPMWLFREFFVALAMSAKIALHLDCRHGENAHHMIEALFKALGKAISIAYAPAAESEMSTKGSV
ncbi:MAG: imidazoleglycerol-phosphate dehydratase HisB [Spirochaetales bacterium]|nr:imidazoleglycerol-phosphate dehydratase HisB [Spirochaetales bacterium]